MMAKGAFQSRQVIPQKWRQRKGVFRQKREQDPSWEPRDADLIMPGTSSRHSMGAQLRSEEDFRAPFNLIGPAIL